MSSTETGNTPWSKGRVMEHRVTLLPAEPKAADYYDEHGVYELLAKQRVRDDYYIGMRLDGVSFSSFTKDMEKPFDDAFQGAMDDVCRYLLNNISDLLAAYVQSDEISLVFKQDTEWFDRRTEKLLSVVPAMASAKISDATRDFAPSRLPYFDARLLFLPALNDVRVMLDERQLDSAKNAVSCIMYWYLRQNEGMSGKAADSYMRNIGDKRERELWLRDRHIDVPWDKSRGRLHTRETYEKEGYNPISKETVVATRRRLVLNTELPRFAHLSDEKFLETLGVANG